jgi:hypothetical protein
MRKCEVCGTLNPHDICDRCLSELDTGCMDEDTGEDGLPPYKDSWALANNQ